MNCPKCDVINPPGTTACDCGYDFKTKEGGKFKRLDSVALGIALGLALNVLVAAVLLNSPLVGAGLVLGATQFVYLAPLIILLRSRGCSSTAKGLIVVLCITFLGNAGFAYIAISALSGLK